MAEGGRARVVVTGIGCVTPIGTGREGLWTGLRERRSRVGPVTRFDARPFRTRIAAEIDGFDPADWIEPRRLRRLDRYSALAVAAARMALDDAGLDPGSVDSDRAAVQLGSALGGVEFAEAQHEAYLDRGVRGVDPMLALTVFGGAASCNVAIEMGFTGPNATNAMSCASGAIGVGRAFRLVRGGEADVALGGGAEAPLAPLSFGAFAILRAMSTRNDDPSTASRPFDRDRDGFVMGEGASILTLESLEHARRRDARIHAEVCGFGTTNDAYHMTRPRPDGTQAARAMRLALEDAGVGASAVDYINAHGSSTTLNDPTEVSAIRTVHGDRSSRIPISGTKGYYGHALGASGAIEAAIVTLALARDWLPPTLNLATAAAECAGLDLVDGDGLDSQPEYALSNSFGFGGINAALLLRRWEG